LILRGESSNGLVSGSAVVHFCGHRIAGARFTAAVEDAVAERIADAVRSLRVGYAYGSLARGADILWACDYVGHRPLAKNYGRFRMYRLRHG
jgi:hypothetical protein